MSSESSNESDYAERTKPRKVPPKKRRRTIKIEQEDVQSFVQFPLQDFLSLLPSDLANEEGQDTFEQLIEPLLPDFLAARTQVEKGSTELDDNGNLTRPLRPSEQASFVEELTRKEKLSQTEALILRKLKLAQQRNVAHISEPHIVAPDSALTPLPPNANPPINPEVLESLYNIQTTPFASSFLARLHGTRGNLPPGLIAVDWESRTPWMNLMADIREHYTFAHPERECPVEEVAPITYSTLHAYQLSQVHDLLEGSFWKGIDVSDALDYLPERTTVVAMYKKVVVGIAIIMSPIQTYITYFAVKAGWDKAQIARTMLFHLISMHPDKDFTLHVSTNSSAMLLYNQFGFKAEEFVAGFYSCYLDPNSRASKNAFRLRLRHL